MRVLRVVYAGHTFYAALQGDSLQCLNKHLGLTEPIALKDVTVVPPVMPTKIVCAGLNYKGHAAELGMDLPVEPLIFLKPPTTIIGTGQDVVLPPESSRVDYEGELGVVIGKTGRRIPERKVAEHVFGYVCANDVTARDLQQRDGLFARAKGFDTFCPVGPWIETQVPDPSTLGLRTLLNSEVQQEDSTANMIFSPFELISFVSCIMTLHPGDLILTGTPAGIGAMENGDEVRVEIDGVGVLINSVSSEQQPTQAPSAVQ